MTPAEWQKSPHTQEKLQESSELVTSWTLVQCNIVLLSLTECHACAIYASSRADHQQVLYIESRTLFSAPEGQEAAGKGKTHRFLIPLTYTHHDAIRLDYP